MVSGRKNHLLRTYYPNTPEHFNVATQIQQVKLSASQVNMKHQLQLQQLQVSQNLVTVAANTVAGQQQNVQVFTQVIANDEAALKSLEEEKAQLEKTAVATEKKQRQAEQEEQQQHQWQQAQQSSGGT